MVPFLLIQLAMVAVLIAFPSIVSEQPVTTPDVNKGRIDVPALNLPAPVFK